MLEKPHSLQFNQDFFYGYSPDRINLGNKERRITSIKKVKSGSTFEIAEEIDVPYNEIITTGKHKADSVKVSEDAKAAKNSKRDLDIALINELVLIFNRMGIDIETVLNTASSKWNFMPFRTGLVDGYCIGIDPFNQSTKLRLQVIIKRLS